MSRVISLLLVAFLMTITPGIAGTIHRPVIFSYYWPISHEGGNPLIWNMESPNFIDIPFQKDSKWEQSEAYWNKHGKTILYRVYPFRTAKSEKELFELFSKRLALAKGISVDEIVTHRLTPERSEIFVNVLKNIRKEYPDKIIAVWCSGNWNKSNTFVLEAIRDYADMYLPELYISQRVGNRKGLGRFKSHVESCEQLVPGIAEITVVGLGVYPKMADDPESDFGDHVIEQIRLLGTDPFFKIILGVALYAPVYLSSENQKRIDAVIKKYFIVQ
jgi:hypothetical protein